MTILSASTLSGDKVCNPEGENLGKIEDFMIDIDSGRIRYAVLSFGGVLGMNNKLFAVPPESLTVDREHHRMVLDVDKDTLEHAPGFDKDNWPDFADSKLGTTIYKHYGKAPYWS